VIYLSGKVHRDLPPEVGVMLTPIRGDRIPDNRTWAADTGCFATPERYNTVRYLAWLRERQHAAYRCLFATAPDVVGDAVATLDQSLPVLAQIRGLGFPAALVAQDGLEALDVPWDDFDCLFVGGTTAWKLSEAAYALAQEAKARGKWCHMGRVNSLRRLRAATIGGYDSCDGTFLVRAPDANLPRMERWLEVMKRQPPLWKGAS
jgi:hypothetical protein